MQHLNQLVLGGNQFKGFPEIIGSLFDLRELQLKQANIAIIPRSIGNLTKLEELDLGLNFITSLPESFSQLVSLKKLTLSHNHLKRIPDTIANLKSLTYLDLEDNEIKYIPDSVGELKSLIELNLQGNQIENLPETLTEIKDLDILNLNSNPLIKDASSKNLILLERLREQGVTVLYTEEKDNLIHEFEILTPKLILSALSEEWQPIQSLVRKLGVRTMMAARYLQEKLKEFERKSRILVEVKHGKKYWKLNTK